MKASSMFWSGLAPPTWRLCHTLFVISKWNSMVLRCVMKMTIWSICWSHMAATKRIIYTRTNLEFVIFDLCLRFPNEHERLWNKLQNNKCQQPSWSWLDLTSNRPSTDGWNSLRLFLVLLLFAMISKKHLMVLNQVDHDANLVFFSVINLVKQMYIL